MLAALPAGASLLQDVIECIEARELRVDGQCAEVAQEALESERVVEGLADAMINRKEHRKATVLLTAALRRYPGGGGLQNRLSVAQSYADEMEAIAARDRARSAQPNAEQLAASMTRIRCTRLSGEPGLAACEAALASAPNDPDLLVAKANLLAADGRIPQALALFNTAMQIRPNDVIVRQKIALLSGRKDRPTAPAVAVASLAPPTVAAPSTRRRAAASSAADRGGPRAAAGDAAEAAGEIGSVGSGVRGPSAHAARCLSEPAPGRRRGGGAELRQGPEYRFRQISRAGHRHQSLPPPAGAGHRAQRCECGRRGAEGSLRLQRQAAARPDTRADHRSDGRDARDARPKPTTC